MAEQQTVEIADRQRFIGGTDAAGVLGLSRWATPLSVWADKTGQVERKTEDSLRLTLGMRLEEVVAELFTQKTGKKVQRANERRVHPKHPFLAAQIDRLVVGEDALLECKTANSWKAKEWEGEEIPREYIIQVNHQLAVTGKKRGYIAALIGNEHFFTRTIERDEELLRQMVKKEVEFWNNFIVPKIMPGLEMISKDDADVLYALYPIVDPGSVMRLDDEANKIIDQRNALISDQIVLDGLRAKLENQLKAILGKFEYGQSEQYIVSWKEQRTRRIDSGLLKEQSPDIYERFLKETPTRVLRIKGATRG